MTLFFLMPLTVSILLIPDATFPPEASTGNTGYVFASWHLGYTVTTLFSLLSILNNDGVAFVS